MSFSPCSHNFGKYLLHSVNSLLRFRHYVTLCKECVLTNHLTDAGLRRVSRCCCCCCCCCCWQLSDTSLKQQQVSVMKTLDNSDVSWDNCDAADHIQYPAHTSSEAHGPAMSGPLCCKDSQYWAHRRLWAGPSLQAESQSSHRLRFALGFFLWSRPVPWCLSRPVCPPLAQAAAAQERADDIGWWWADPDMVTHYPGAQL